MLGILVTDPDLVRFVEAQDSVRHRVVEELTAGQKRTHWMWFVFRLGMAERYAIRRLEPAQALPS